MGRKDSFLAGLFAALLLSWQAAADAASSAPPVEHYNGVSMTMYPVVKGGDGQQYYLDPNRQAQPLPGAGVTTSGVGVYRAPDGSQWYVDRTGTQQMLNSAQQQISLTSQTPADGSAYSGPAYGGYDYPYDNQPPPASVQNNYYQSEPPQSGSSSSGSSSGGGLNLSLGLGGVPWGIPMYYGAGGAPYYYGAGGSPVYVNRTVENSNQFSEFNQQNNNWHRTTYNNWHNNFNNNNTNWNNHWGRNNWPGRDHGFPPPWDQHSGRLYGSQDGQGFARGDRSGGSGPWGGTFGGGERRDGGGGERRDGGGGERRHGGGGERRDGGGGEPRDGGERRDGGGGHHGGGGHRR